jgi:Rrf2 family protein
VNKLSKKTEYALMALKLFYELDLQSKETASAQKISVSAKYISEHTHAPYDVVARVLQVLSSRGVLKAEYGVMGGYQLSKNLCDITVFELTEILESSTELAHCLGADGDCDLIKKCSIVTPITNLNLKVRNFYKSISLQEVLHVPNL